MRQLVREKTDLIADAIYSIAKQQEKDIRSNGLYDGDSGMLLFTYYYTTLSDAPRYKTIVNDLINQILHTLENGRFIHTLCSGLAGILYLFDFLKKQEFIAIDIEEYEELLESYLIRGMNSDIRSHNYDFMHGALGIGLYFLRKQKRQDVILQLVAYLDQTAEKDPDSKTCKWTSSFMDADKQKCNISLSHGMAGIVLFLSRVLSNKIVSTQAEALLDGAVNYLLAQEVEGAVYGSHFPNFSLEDKETAHLKSRLAWCYGDLGVAYAIWFAGKTVHHISWQKKGLQILLDSTARTADTEDSVIDAGICHGTSGIAMIYRRMFIETKDERFLRAAEYWVSQTLKHSTFNDGPAGYKSYEKGRWINDYSLLTGIAGIGLTFISFLTNDMQDWDELLLLSYQQ